MAKKQSPSKTNAMRELDRIGAEYIYRSFAFTGHETGAEIAQMLNLDPDTVFKTLVTVGKSTEHYVFMIPVAEELDLKKAAQAVGEKSIHMVKSKELLELTGYIHGGCSPLGMKKFFTTTVDETALLLDRIIFSGGKQGLQIETTLDALQQAIDIQLADLVIS